MHHPTWLFSALVVGTHGFRRSRCEEASSCCVRGFRFARCDKSSSRCILMIIYFVLLAGSFCLCGFCLRDVCRQYWNRRKTIPYTDEDPVPGTVGDAAPPDAVENAGAADDA